MEPWVASYVFIFGLLIGSFLNVLILRLPLKKDVIKTRSACPHCGNQLKWFHNIPVVSFIALKGKCSFCGERISWRYPLIELFTGLVSLFLMPHEFSLPALSAYMFYFSISCVFICHLIIDLEHHLLLDSLNLYLLAIIATYALFTYSWEYWLAGAAFGFIGPLSVTWLFYKIRGQIGLGGGDIKLFGILGLLFGPVGIMFTIFMSCLVGALVGLILIFSGKLTKDRPMAFGPAILLVAAGQIYFPYYTNILQSWFF